MTAYAGMKMLFDALNEAESTTPADIVEVISGWDKDLGSYATGYGAKFDDDKQNTLALPTVLQWQSGATVTVYPEDAKLPESQVLGTSG
jgi:branched-chain amino acid transport system substrate-binding protein